MFTGAPLHTFLGADKIKSWVYTQESLVSKEGNNCSVANFLHIVQRIPSWSHAGVNQYQDQINQLVEKPDAIEPSSHILSVI